MPSQQPKQRANTVAAWQKELKKKLQCKLFSLKHFSKWIIWLIEWFELFKYTHTHTHHNIHSLTPLVSKHPAVQKITRSVDFHLLRGHMFDLGGAVRCFIWETVTLCPPRLCSAVAAGPSKPNKGWSENTLSRITDFSSDETPPSPHTFFFLPLSLWLYFNLPLSVPQLVRAGNLHESNRKNEGKGSRKTDKCNLDENPISHPIVHLTSSRKLILL